MKKFYLGVLGCLLAMGANAQTLNPIGTVGVEFLSSIGKDYPISGKGMAYTAESLGDGLFNVKLYNEEFQELRSLNLKFGVNNYYGIGIALIDIEESTFGEQISGGLTISQSLFNNDEKIEYVRHIYAPNDENRVKTFMLVNEDEEVLATIDTPADSKYSYPRILKWGDKHYFAICSYTADYNSSLDIYLIEKETSSVRKVNSAPLMRAIPALAERNSTVNVTLDAETVKNGGELIITDSNGRTVGRSFVEAGQTSVPVTTDRMGSGVYNITLTEKGQKVENARIIVK